MSFGGIFFELTFVPQEILNLSYDNLVELLAIVVHAELWYYSTTST
jgi:hypothetical protein